MPCRQLCCPIECANPWPDNTHLCVFGGVLLLLINKGNWSSTTSSLFLLTWLNLLPLHTVVLLVSTSDQHCSCTTSSLQQQWELFYAIICTLLPIVLLKCIIKPSQSVIQYEKKNPWATTCGGLCPRQTLPPVCTPRQMTARLKGWLTQCSPIQSYLFSLFKALARVF